VAGAPAPVVAVSPFVGGRSVKGPSEHFCAWAGVELSATGIARVYKDLIDGVVADEPVDGMRCLVTGTLMDTPERRRRVASEVLHFADTALRSR